MKILGRSIYFETGCFNLTVGILSETRLPGINIIFFPEGEHLESGLRMLSYYSDWSFYLSHRWPFVVMRYHVCDKEKYSNIVLSPETPHQKRKIVPHQKSLTASGFDYDAAVPVICFKPEIKSL